MVDKNTLSRFMSLFTGNSRSFGEFNPQTKKMVTWEGNPPEEKYSAHLNGVMGLGIVPITDDDTCLFAAVDIDNHNGEIINISDIKTKIDYMKLPLVPTKSKSGGAHLYLFGVEPLDAKLVQSLMAKWANDLGFPGVEIFPKQYHLKINHDGSRALGNWINIPYFNCEDSVRHTIKDDGTPADFDYFLSVAEEKRVTQLDVDNFYTSAHPDAPPCIQKIIAGQINSGHRNEALYNLTIYLKKAFPNDYRSLAFDINTKSIFPPLAHAEAKRTINSASRRAYHYRCNEEPSKSLCNRAVCLNRKFGITASDVENIDAIDNMPEFTELKKYTTDPVIWELTVGGKRLNVSTDTLMNYSKIRERIADELTVLVPILPKGQWDSMLGELIKNALIVDAPDDASIAGIIRSKLFEFMDRADLAGDGTNTADREALLRGQPVLQVFGTDKERCVMFRGVDFVEYLKYSRSEELKGSNLWFALKKAGVKHGRVRAAGKIVNVWYIPVGDSGNPNFTPKVFDMDF